ncbi:hypothetical protein TrLO_g7047 [Triparma laevis f. longispina]|uniref:Magnesium transporter n=1 Tax=Triparma laevis f. longispina TaxID=1714387 RepID=A0A9W7FU17_9STRA|nr:hypothetical protein TrLO_g7047 [Triparma laevis f. longispina]
MVHWRWSLGLFLGLTATFCASINKVFWKLGHNNHVSNPKISFYANCVATFALVVNPVLDMLSLYFAPQTLFAATAGTGTVFNLILSHYILKEKPTSLDIYGAIAVLIGCTGIAWSEANIVPTEDNYEKMIERFESPAFLSYLSITTIFISTLLFVTVQNSESCCPEGLRKFAYGSLGGSIGGQYYLVKSSISLVANSETVTGGSVFQEFDSYLIIGGAILAAAGGVIVLNFGLKKYDALFIAPMYQAFLVIYGSVSGAVFYQELSDLTFGELMMFCFSFVVMIMGICCCMWREGEEGGGKGLVERKEDYGGMEGVIVGGVEEKKEEEVINGML